MLQAAKAKAKQAKQAKAAVSWQMSMASKVADLLRSIVDKALDNPPAATPGTPHPAQAHTHGTSPSMCLQKSSVALAWLHEPSCPEAAIIQL